MAKLKFRPLHDRVVVKRIDAESKSAGGIIIPDTAKASSFRLTSRSATRCCSANGRAPRSSSMARSS